jgi:HSP20 family protein
MKATIQKETRPTDHREALAVYVSPEVNIFETNDGYVLEAEMAGVRKEGLEITLDGNEMTIVGHRNSETVPGQALFREALGRDYRRVFEIDPAIDSAKISAKMEQGLLTLQLPKSEKVKPRKIAVE